MANLSPLWFRRQKPIENPRLRLLAIPNAGRGASMFRLWGDLLPPDIEVCGVQLPGRENRLREPAFTDIREVVAAILREFESALQEPFAVYGHSVGALIAYALTTELRKKGRPLPTHLFVSGRKAPTAPKTPPIHNLPDDELLFALESRYGGIPEPIRSDKEFLAMTIPIVRADVAVMNSYDHPNEPPLPLPITAFSGDRDPSAPPSDVEAWKGCTAASFLHVTLAGDHYFPDGERVRLVETLRKSLT